MRAENTLRGLALLFNSYSILVTIFILAAKTLENQPMTPLEISILATVAVALLFGMLADVVSK